jgi:hypothetical protein
MKLGVTLVTAEAHPHCQNFRWRCSLAPLAAIP